MDKSKIYCLALHNSDYDSIKNLGYLPVGLKNDNFSDEWLRDNTGQNISAKNPFYGEYTFHYWLWKNYLHKIEVDNWIGFCGYKYFWKQEKDGKNEKKNVLRYVPSEWDDYEAIIADPQFVDNIKISKILKNGSLSFLFDQRTYFKNKQNIKFHFQVFHGKNSLDKAIDLLDDENREPFRRYVNDEKSFHKWNMFICKSKEKIINYYTSVFQWLYKCEKIFGFDLKGYGQKRMYGFLAERYLSYWFTKNTKFLSWPAFRLDIDQD